MIVPDSNLLLYAYDVNSPSQAAAAAWWSKVLAGSEAVGLAPPALIGFLRISTHAHAFRQPLTVAAAVAAVRSWLVQPPVIQLATGPSHTERVCDLVAACGTAGNLCSDADLAAYALAHGGEVYTADSDFSRFPGVRWRNPLA